MWLFFFLISNHYRSNQYIFCPLTNQFSQMTYYSQILGHFLRYILDMSLLSLIGLLCFTYAPGERACHASVLVRRMIIIRVNVW